MHVTRVDRTTVLTSPGRTVTTYLTTTGRTLSRSKTSILVLKNNPVAKLTTRLTPRLKIPVLSKITYTAGLTRSLITYNRAADHQKICRVN